MAELGAGMAGWVVNGKGGLNESAGGRAEGKVEGSHQLVGMEGQSDMHCRAYGHTHGQGHTRWQMSAGVLVGTRVSA